MKRICLLLLVFVFLFTAACGDGGENTPAGTNAPAAPTPEPVSDTRYVRWTVTEARTYPLVCADAEYGWGKLCLLGEQEEKPVLLYGGTEPRTIALDRSYALVAAGPEAVWLGVETALVCLDDQGNQTLSLTLSEKTEDMTCDGDGNLWAAHKSTLTLVRIDGSTETVSLPQGFTAGTLCRLGSGGIGVFASKTKGDVSPVLRLTAEDREPKPLEGAEAWPMVGPGEGTADFYYYMEWGKDHPLSGGKQIFRFADGRSTPALDLAGLGHEGQLRGICPDGADFIVLYTTEDSAGFLRLKRTEAEKQILTMARLENNHINSDLIDRFNAEHPEYYLVSRLYGDEDELHLDILAGERPDLLSGMCVSTEVYAAKGLLADLYPYLEREPELLADLVPSVLKSLETYGGKLTQLCPDYVLYTCAAPKRYVGDADRWTLADLERICTENPELTLWGPERGMKLLDVMLCAILEHFADLESQELHFDSPEFIAYLDFLLEMDQRAQSFSGSFDYADGDILFCVENFTSVAGESPSAAVSGYVQALAQLDMDALKFVGFPAEGGTGCRINATSLFSVMAGTGNEEAAWTFLRWTLEESVQETMTTYIPIRKSVLEAQLKQAGEGTPETTVTRYKDPVGAANGTNTETYTVTVPAVPGLSEAELNLFRDLLDRAEGLYQDARTHPCYELIYRECADYFSGKKTSAETAASIQAKMAIYLAERG